MTSGVCVSICIAPAILVLAGLWVSQHWALDLATTNHPICLPVASRSLFGSLQQEQEALRIYRKQQAFEYKVLRSALDVEVWKEAIAVQLDTTNDNTVAAATTRHRLIWDTFAPFYNCPLKERVGTPPVL